MRQDTKPGSKRRHRTRLRLEVTNKTLQKTIYKGQLVNNEHGTGEHTQAANQ